MPTKSKKKVVNTKPIPVYEALRRLERAYTLQSEALEKVTKENEGLQAEITSLRGRLEDIYSVAEDE